MATTDDLLRYLFRNGIEYSLCTHIQTNSMLELSLDIGVPEYCIARTSVLRIDDQVWMVVAPGDRKLDFTAVRNIFHAKKIPELDQNDRPIYFPGCDPATIPPFGNFYGVSVLADRSFSDCKRIVVPAYSRVRSVFMRWCDFVPLVDPLVAEICQTVQRPSLRKRELDTASS